MWVHNLAATLSPSSSVAKCPRPRVLLLRALQPEVVSGIKVDNNNYELLQELKATNIITFCVFVQLHLLTNKGGIIMNTHTLTRRNGCKTAIYT